MEEVDVQRAGQIVKLSRIEAMLEVLFLEGFTKRNVRAITEYLDRTLGKSKESMDLEVNGKILVLSSEAMDKYGLNTNPTPNSEDSSIGQAPLPSGELRSALGENNDGG